MRTVSDLVTIGKFTEFKQKRRNPLKIGDRLAVRVFGGATGYQTVLDGSNTALLGD